jgi:hypothetical protein
MSRWRRSRSIERRAGREWALRQTRAEAIAKLRAARESGDVEFGPLGLIHAIPPAGEIVTQIAKAAERFSRAVLFGMAVFSLIGGMQLRVSITAKPRQVVRNHSDHLTLAFAIMGTKVVVQRRSPSITWRRGDHGYDATRCSPPTRYP